MKLIADEHVSPKIVRAVCEIALARTCSLASIVKGAPYVWTEDEDWIERFAKDGGNGILSADRRMLKRPNLVQLMTDHDLVGIFLPAE